MFSLHTKKKGVLTGIDSPLFPFQPSAERGNKPEENQVSNTSPS